MAYDTTDTNWQGTGSTEEEWRKRYPIPGEIVDPTKQTGMATGGGYEYGTTPYGNDTQVNVLPSPTAPAPAPSPTLPADWLGAPEASDTALPAQYWQRVMAAHGGAMTPEQKAYVEQNIAAGVQPGATFTPPAGTPGATTPGAVPTAGQPGYVPPNLAPGTPGPTDLDTQNQNAQTYSGTPGAAPANNTTNQGTQDTVRNTYLQQLQKGTTVDTMDPNFRMQSDAYAAAQERQRRNSVDDAQEAAFAQGSSGAGAVNLAKMYADEQAGQNVGAFEADLVGRELTNRRDEIRNALSSLGGMIDADQKLALNRELAALDAALKREGLAQDAALTREGLAQQGSLGMADIGLRGELGRGGLNVDMMRLLLQQQLGNAQLGANIGDSEMNYMLRLAGL